MVSGKRVENKVYGQAVRPPKRIIWLIMTRILKDEEKPILYVHKEYDNLVKANEMWSKLIKVMQEE